MEFVEKIKVVKDELKEHKKWVHQITKAQMSAGTFGEIVYNVRAVLSKIIREDNQAYTAAKKSIDDFLTFK